MLRAGDYVALIRHATATAGREGSEARPDDCETQRKLTDQGRAEARTLGERFRAEGVRVGKVLTSLWCRCRETATLMDVGTPEVATVFNAPHLLPPNAPPN
jgi:phosphohistidine phosphatase SixA